MDQPFPPRSIEDTKQERHVREQLLETAVVLLPGGARGPIFRHELAVGL